MSEPNIEYLTREQNNTLLNGCCPDCHTSLILAGPKGGLSVNVLCAYCRSEFNLGPMTHRNPSPCSPERQLQVFGLDVTKFPNNSFPAHPRPQYLDSLEERLQEGECERPECNQEHLVGREMFLCPPCHPKAGVTVCYRKGTNVLWLTCHECSSAVGAVAVAERDPFTMSEAEVDAALAAEGIDPTEAVKRVLEIVQKARSKAERVNIQNKN